ncbi:MAG: hypothetical protein U0872_11460 [Planctomycetaceae bacterium]
MARAGAEKNQFVTIDVFPTLRHCPAWHPGDGLLLATIECNNSIME